MELALFIWFASVVRGLSILMISAPVIIIVLALFISVIQYEIGIGKDSADKTELFLCTWKGKALMFACVASVFMSVILPSEKTLYLMAGGYTAQSIATSELGGKVKKVIELKVDEYLLDAEKSLQK